jgi:hypothetical protein
VGLGAGHGSPRARPLGYGSASALAEACETTAGQSEAVVRYLTVHGLAPYLAALPDRSAAERFVVAYNGPGHARHDYAGRLIDTWKRAGKGRADEPGRDTRALRAALARLGHYPDCIDGPRARAAIRAFQTERGTVADGIAGPMTWAEIDAATTQARDDTRQRRARQVAAGGSTAAIATPALAEIVQEADSITATAQSLLTTIGLAGPLLALAVAAVVGLVIWRTLR